MSTAPFTFEPLEPEDLDGVLAIERTAYPYPWSRDLFERELTYEWGHLIGRFDATSRRLVGYVCYWLVHDEVHVLNVAVDAAHRRAGHGRALVEHVVSFAQAHGCVSVTLEVRRTNVGAQALYRALGFVQVGVRPRYYMENGEDALLMTRTL